jgi:hypothetical protein
MVSVPEGPASAVGAEDVLADGAVDEPGAGVAVAPGEHAATAMLAATVSASMMVRLEPMNLLHLLPG